MSNEGILCDLTHSSSSKWFIFLSS